MELALWVIVAEVLVIGFMVFAGLKLFPAVPRPAFDAPWDGYRGKRRMGAQPDRDWVIA